MSVLQVGKWARGVALPPDWWVPKADGRTLDLDFGAGAYWDNAAGAQGIGAAASFDRNSQAGRFGPAGLYESVAADVLRRDYDPATLAARGALIEAAVAYAGVNSLLTGAVAGVVGSGGVKPDGMIIGRPNGLSEEVSLGTTDGVPWVEIRIFGTASSTAAISIFLNASTGTAALQGQTWRHALYVAVTDDDPAVTVLQLQVSERSNVGGFLAAAGATSIYADRLTWARRSISATLANASTANIQQQIATGSITSGTAIDWKIRIGLATLTQTRYLPSPFAVGTSADTRLADDLSRSITGLIGAAEGGLYFEGAPINAATAQILGGLYWAGGDLIEARRTGAGRIVVEAVSGGVQVAYLDLGAHIDGALVKVALGWAESDLAARMSGGSLLTDSSFPVPVGAPTLRLGSRPGPVYLLNGHLRRAAMWSSRGLMTNTLIGSLVA